MEVERIRGVKSDHAVNRLVEFGLIEEVGRLDAPGRPMLFATTEEFLNRFGVDSLKDLPALPEGVEKLLREEVTEELKDGFGLEAEEESEEAVVNNEEAVANNEEAVVNNEEAEGEGIEKEEPFTKDYFDIEGRKDEEVVKEEAKAESPET